MLHDTIVTHAFKNTYTRVYYTIHTNTHTTQYLQAHTSTYKHINNKQH